MKVLGQDTGTTFKSLHLKGSLSFSVLTFLCVYVLCGGVGGEVTIYTGRCQSTAGWYWLFPSVSMKIPGSQLVRLKDKQFYPLSHSGGLRKYY